MNDTLMTRKKLDLLLVQYQFAQKQADQERRILNLSETRVGDVAAAQRYLQDIAQATQQSVHRRLASVVTRCLKAVFGDGAYEFEIDFVRRRGRTEADMWFVRKDGKKLDPLTEAEGGAVDVASLGLRLACLMLSQPELRRLIVLDEPLKNLNGLEFQDKAAQLILSLAEDLGVQFIIVTDDDWLKVGNVVNLDNG